MGSRKRAKPNPPTEDTNEAPEQNSGSDTQAQPVSILPPRNDNDPRPSSAGLGASWQPSKSLPVTNISHESITANLPRGTSPGKTASIRESSAVAPLDSASWSARLASGSFREKRAAPVASITKVNAVSEASQERATSASTGTAEEHKQDVNAIKKTDQKLDQTLAPRPEQPLESRSNDIPVLEEPQRDAASPWLKWISRTDGTKPNASAPNLSQPEAAPDPLPIPVSGLEAVKNSDIPSRPLTPQSVIATKAQSLMSSSPQEKSWFFFWKAAADDEAGAVKEGASAEPTTQKDADAPKSAEQSTVQPAVEQQPVQTQSKSADHPPLPSKKSDDVSKSAGWAFWSRGQPGETSSASGGSESFGELAVANTSSQSHPEAAGLRELAPARVSSLKAGSKRERPKSMEIAEGMDPSSTSNSPKLKPQLVSSVKDLEQRKDSAAEQTNLVMPSFSDTYRLADNPSILQQIARWLHYGKEESNKHLHIVRDPPRIKRAVAIGVHGYFPAALLLRTMIGQPTGTSIKFANSAAAAIERYIQSKGYSCEIEKVALEGQGMIFERVETMWKLLLNWIDHIRQADFILIACHSQGVPVSIMLLAKLISFGCVNSTRIGLCCMAGINLGPFMSLKSRLLSGSAGELFEFANPKSSVSRRYEEALRTVTDHGVRIAYIGGLDDQVVSLESSTFSTARHPLIYRAVYVDTRLGPPDFITHLVALALKLRNLGVSDHGLVRELSMPLAGSLYSGEGHSRLYDDDRVYDLAVQHAIETAGAAITTPLTLDTYEGPTNNPFILPWCMRGVLEERYVKTELYQETTALLEQFDHWKPASKALKDVKFRLEAIRSKL